MLDELRMLKRRRNEGDKLRQLQVVPALRNERARLEGEIKICDAGAAVSGKRTLSDIESEELSVLHSSIASKRARVNERGLQTSEVQIIVGNWLGFEIAG